MSKLQTPEETILNTLLLKTHLEKVGCYDEVVEAMHTHTNLALDELARRIKEDGDLIISKLQGETLEQILSQLKSDLQNK